MPEKEPAFVLDEEKGYWRAIMPGSLLQYAKGQPKQIPLMNGKEQVGMVDLRFTAWLNQTVRMEMGLVGSIRNEHFLKDATYMVFFSPEASPPYLFAIRMAS